MMFKTALALFAVAGTASAESIRAATKAEPADAGVEHLDLEIVNEQGERELFPLLPGTKCPTGMNCRARTQGVLGQGQSPLVGAIRDNMKLSAKQTLNWEEFNTNVNTMVVSNNRCDRRQAMARAAGILGGAAVATVGAPAYAAETKTVLMGSDSGLLAFVPAKLEICKGDSVKWMNNKGGPHNVVFDEDNVPSGVDAESIGQSEQMGEEGESYTSKPFDKPGTYGYYCEPHRGAGMQGTLVVA